MDNGNSQINLLVNGAEVNATVDTRTSLWELLHRYLGCRDVHYGCGEGVCGACTVVLDGEPVCSCLMLAMQANGRKVVTATGLDKPDSGFDSVRIGLLRDQLLAREAFQCGYCAPGMLTSAAHYLSGDASSSSDLKRGQIRRAISGNLCRCTGYELIEQAIDAVANGEAAPNVPDTREDLRAKLNGNTRYPTDYDRKDALVGRVLWSEWPSAKIISIDTSEAESMPRVQAVMTHQDIPARNLSPSIFAGDQPLLAAKQVRTMGDAIALVAADDEITARQAIQRIRVVYERLTPVTDVRQALEPDAHRLGQTGNVVALVTETRGDVETAFKHASLVVEGTYQCTINDHACMELVGGTGWLEGEEMFLSIGTQTPHIVRKGIARSLGLSERNIHIVAPSMGGAFGKYLAPSVDNYLALLVHKTRRAVRLVLDREEVLTRTTKRHPFVGKYRLALKNDGTFLALEADILTDAGPYISLTPVVVAIFAVEATGAYEIPNAKITSRGVLTNNLLPAPMRGFGSQQVNLGIECLVDKAARLIGIEPERLRRLNYRKADGPAQVDQAETKNWLVETIDCVVQRLGTAPQPPTGWLAGRGVASIHAKYGYPYGLIDRFTARVSVDGNGSFLVESDIPDAGSGVVAGISRLVADSLALNEIPRYRQSQAAVDDPSGILFSTGAPPSSIRSMIYRSIEMGQTKGAALLQFLLSRMEPSDAARILRLGARPGNLLVGLVNRLKSALFPYGLDSFNPRISGSRAMFMVGRAAVAAAENLKISAVKLAANKLKVPMDELYAALDGVRHVSDSNLRISWAELAINNRGELSAVGESHLPAGPLIDASTGNQTGPVDSAIASHGCDLAVNPETGEVRIMRYVACHDVGKILNPQAVYGQLIGGIVMGIGQALFERIDVSNGRVLTTGLHDYLVPSSLDLPENIEIEMLESKSGLGPSGAKGVGEAGAVAAPIVIANALYDALGVQPTSIPAMPDDIVSYWKESLAIKSTSSQTSPEGGSSWPTHMTQS